MDRGDTPLFRSLYPARMGGATPSTRTGTTDGMAPGLGIYLHIPFCRVKCPYCAFVVFTGRTALREDYVDAMARHIARAGRETNADAAGLTRGPDGRLPVRTIYLGGGTPTTLPVAQLARLLDSVRAHFAVADDVEITVETEPGTTSPDAFGALVAAGVDRVTIGVQSFDARHLQTLGRPHDPDGARRAIEDAREAGVANLDLDLMFGYPDQTLDDWHRDLDAAFAHRPEHLSLYNLTVEPGTPYATRAKQGALPLPEEDVQAAMMRAAMDRCGDAGLVHYEISNFARPGRASRHNAGYWNGVPYLGVGVGAHGFLPRGGVHGEGRRGWNVRSPERYIEAIASGAPAEEDSEDLDREAAILEAAYLGMRQRRGLDRASFEARFGPRPIEGAAPELARLRESGVISDEPDRVRLTEEGVIIADYAISRIVASLDTFGGFDTVDGC